MFRRIATVCLMSGLLLLAAGCTAVTFEKPLGTEPNPKLAERLDGKWDTATSIGAVMVQHTKSNEVVLGMTEWDKDENAFIVRNLDGLVMDFGDQSILNLKMRDGEMGGNRIEGWMVLRIKASNDQIVAWSLNGEMIEALVEEEELEGDIKDKPDYIMVTEDDAETIFKLFSQIDQAELWNMDEPLVARPLSD